MRKLISALAATGFLVAACTTAEQTQFIQLSADAFPCYAAVTAAVTGKASSAQPPIIALTLATDPSCVALDSATLTLISTAIQTGKTVTPAATTTATPAAITP